jgi:hypothetical protein
MTALRSTRKYCSEACRQKAKRVRRKQERNPFACWICGKDVYGPDSPGALSKDAQDRLFAATGRRWTPRRYCGGKCRAEGRARHRAYRDAEKLSGGRSVSQERSGAVIFTLPELPSQAAFERLRELFLRPGRNTVVIRVPGAADSLGPVFNEITFTGSALTARDGMWVALALSGLGAQPRVSKPPVAATGPEAQPRITQPVGVIWRETHPAADLSFESFFR